MMNTREVYEKKIYNEDSPAQLFVEYRMEEGLYFWPHWHEEIEILYVTEGSAKITLEQQEYLLEKGSMIIINSNELHSGYCVSTPYICKVLSFKPQNLITYVESQNVNFHPPLIKDKTINNGHVPSIYLPVASSRHFLPKPALGDLQFPNDLPLHEIHLTLAYLDSDILLILRFSFLVLLLYVTSLFSHLHFYHTLRSAK